ncbi:TPA: hypothetical protein ACOEBW_000365 [Enterobacter hormaechei subsp. xiangfangensis]|nr:hypothetical protein [Enterobacter hormaechei]
MALLNDVQKTVVTSLNQIKQLRKAMMIGDSVDIFMLVSVNQSYDQTNFNNQRKTGNFTFQFLLVPLPSTNELPANSFGTILEHFETNTIKEFKDNNVTLFSYQFDNSELDTDPTTGRQSLSFSINIVATQKQ